MDILTRQKEKERVYKLCTRFLNHHYPQTPQQVLSELAALPEATMDEDRYGEGTHITL